MSEAELHIMNSRLLSGRLNKANRGEMLSHAPRGYVVDAAGTALVLDLDEQVQSVIRLVFDKFDELGSVNRLLRYLVCNNICLPIRPQTGPIKGRLEWRRTNRRSLLSILHHPVYAGAYAYGRRQRDPRRRVPGRRGAGRVTMEPKDYLVLIKDHFPAYISWERFEANQRRLRQNRSSWQTLGAPREGTSLLGGLLTCGKCGHRMRIHYGGSKGRLTYGCRFMTQEHAGETCQFVAGVLAQRIFSEHLSSPFGRQPEPAEHCCEALR